MQSVLVAAHCRVHVYDDVDDVDDDDDGDDDDFCLYPFSAFGPFS